MRLQEDRRGARGSFRGSGAFELMGIVVLMLAVPLLIRATLVVSDEAPRRIPYLPVFEGERQIDFAADRILELERMDPGYVVIGDSMAGSRIDELVLARLSGRPVAPVLQGGTGPVFWYLALKNWVIASGIRPRVVFVFFRDTNLTDPLFRLDEDFRWSVGLVATDREDEVNAIVKSHLEGPLHLVHRAVDDAYAADRARRWMKPALASFPSRVVTRNPRRRAQFMEIMNARFGLDHLRTMEAADMATDAGTDFDAEVERSVLPLMLRDASRAGLTLCFVRVQRRPLGNRPPDQTRALRRYVADLEAYIESRGHQFLDDTGDPALTLDTYGDGDHVARQARSQYTAHLYERLRHLFP